MYLTGMERSVYSTRLLKMIEGFTVYPNFISSISNTERMIKTIICCVD